MYKIDKLAKSPKFRHACEGRHPEPFENTGFPPSQIFYQANLFDIVRFFQKTLADFFTQVLL